MSRRVSDAIVASIGVDGLFTRFISKLRCKFVPVPTDLDRQRKVEKTWKEVGDAVRGHFKDRVKIETTLTRRVSVTCTSPSSTRSIFYSLRTWVLRGETMR
jgi:hypothetical protein